MKERADKLLTAQGLAESRQKARALIMAGVVFIGDQRVEKAGQMLNGDEEIKVKNRLPFVGRGGLKLEGALRAFSVDVDGKTALDLGASTGGFTDCLLQNGANRVFAVDVDIRQFDWRLSQDPRIVLIQKNARYLTKEDFSEPLDLVTMDLSFISVLKVLPALKNILNKGWIVSLIKPQFEVGKNQVGKKGIVKDPQLHEEVLSRTSQAAREMGFFTCGIIPSPLRGQKGNREFFILWAPERPESMPVDIRPIIKEAVRNEES
jgi:23S rRNA (cytidine1920-2'-O)/16S rRNA (cytidine1409-2'-O)-methyltransferase